MTELTTNVTLNSGSKGKECKACCEDAGKKCGTDCCKKKEKN